MFQSELLTYGVGCRVPELVRNPACNARLFAAPCDRPAVGMASDREQRLRWIGGQILRQDHLNLRPEMQRPGLPMMGGLVVAQLCRPDFTRSMDGPRCE